MEGDDKFIRPDNVAHRCPARVKQRMFEATANFCWLHLQPEHCGNPAVYDARERLFQSINHGGSQLRFTSVCLCALL